MAMVFAGTTRYRAPWDFLLALLAAFAARARVGARPRATSHAGLERRQVERLRPLGAAHLRERGERALPSGSAEGGGALRVAGELDDRPGRAKRGRPTARRGPSRPPRRSPGRPPTSLAITARPRSIASSATMPNPSPNEGTTTISARSYTGAGGATLPRNVTRSARPSRATVARSCDSSGPSPAISRVSSGTSSRTSRSASSSTSCPLIGISLPTIARRGSPGGGGGCEARLDAVVDDLERGRVEPLVLREVPGKPCGDRDVDVGEPRRPSGRPRRTRVDCGTG